jgi:dihydropteroate synthase
MAVLNVTPDSFSDGGAYGDADAAVAAAVRMVEHGAAMIDVGPESTRPGSSGVPADVQIVRSAPVIAALRNRFPTLPISIDTRRAAVAKAAIDAGATIVNDVSALRDDPAMVGLIAARGASVVLMHMRGTPVDMQAGGGPAYDDVVAEVGEFLAARREHALACGVAADRIYLDPGLGFGKRVEHNVELLRRLGEIVALGSPVVVGASRKRFIGHVAGGEAEPRERLAGSLVCAVHAARLGAAVLRVHDVRETVQALQVAAALEGGLAPG